MRAVLQRVQSGAVRVDGEIVGAIEHGFVILVGVGHGDGEAQAQWLARKIVGLRVFEDADGKFLVRKHTISIPPGTKRSFRVTADALGRWAFHCHMLMHMEAGMMREVRVEE